MSRLAEQIITAIGDNHNATAMVQAVFSVICRNIEHYDLPSDWKLTLRPPGDANNLGNPNCFWVEWRGGPADWAVDVARRLSQITGKTIAAKHGCSLEFDPLQD